MRLLWSPPSACLILGVRVWNLTQLPTSVKGSNTEKPRCFEGGHDHCRDFQTGKNSCHSHWNCKTFSSLALNPFPPLFSIIYFFPKQKKKSGQLLVIQGSRARCELLPDRRNHSIHARSENGCSSVLLSDQFILLSSKAAARRKLATLPTKGAATRHNLISLFFSSIFFCKE